jgi:Fe2+ or Zn2+ uptake regulation protein
MAEFVAELQNRLWSKGQRLTRQRRLILQILQRPNGHLDANAILERAQADYPHIGLSTVYRTLQLLTDMGLAEQRFVNRDHTRKVYERAGPGEHYHFTCLSCGKIIEFRSPLVSRARREVTADLGVTVLRACACFEGYCPVCMKKQQQLARKGRETR